MKAENLKRAQEIVGYIEDLKARLRFLESEHTEIRIGMYHGKFGSQVVESKYLSVGTQAAAKAMALVDVKIAIKALEEELENL